MQEHTRLERRSDSGELIGTTEMFLVDGKLHREDGPARICCRGDRLYEDYYRHGIIHRVDGPAEIITNLKTGIVEREDYWQNGRIPCDANGPVVIFRDHVTGEISRQYWGRDGKIVSAPPSRPNQIREKETLIEPSP